MFKLITGIAEVAIKTTVGLPISVAADALTLGGEAVDKRGQTYTGDMVDSINSSFGKMTEED